MIDLVCIVCPNSCDLKIDEKTLEVTGHKCNRGIDFAINEIKNPMRTFSSTVKTTFVDCTVRPVRVDKDIPKGKIFDVMKEINKVTINKRVKRGDVIIENVLGLNVNVIACSSALTDKE